MKTYPDTPSLYALQQAMLTELFSAETRRLETQLVELCRKNSHILGEAFTGFRYEGKLYMIAGSTRLARYPLLHYDLLDEMETYAKDSKTITSDRTMIGQLFPKLLDVFMDAQEMRNAIPDCMVRFAPDFIRRLSRTKDHEAVMREDLGLSSTTLKQFQQWLPTIEMYAATHLLY